MGSSARAWAVYLCMGRLQENDADVLCSVDRTGTSEPHLTPPPTCHEVVHRHEGSGLQVALGSSLLRAGTGTQTHLSGMSLADSSSSRRRIALVAAATVTTLVGGVTTGSTTSPTPTPRPEQAWTSSPTSLSTSTTFTPSANQPNDASSTKPCSPASPSTMKRTPLTPRADHRQRPRPYRHRRPGARHRRNKTAPPSGGAVSIFSSYVDAGGLSPNTWKRLVRLSAAWEQAKRDGASEQPQAAEPDPGVVLNPTRRSRTPLTPEEVDAIRTARSDDQPAGTIAKRFRINRGTVWEKARGHARSKPVMQARPDHSTPSRSRADG